MSNVILELTKKEIILDSDKNPIGHKLDVRIKKTKLAPYNPKEVIEVNFYYNGGFNQIEEYARLFCELDLAKVGGGGWTLFPSKDGEEKKVQGMDNFMEYLKNNPEDFEFLKQQLA
jgi:hypothetical protein